MAHPEAADVAIITIIPREIDALFSVFNVRDRDRTVRVSHTDYWVSEIHSARMDRPLRVVSTFLVGAAGNTEAAITASCFLRDWHPRLICLVGIAAGVEAKTNIGDVVVPDTIHDATMTVLRQGESIPRMRAFKRDRSVDAFLKVVPPALPARGMVRCSDAELAEMRSHAVALGLGAHQISGDPIIYDGSLYSSNALLKDAAFLEAFQAKFDERCRGGEMEAAGFCRACELERVPWVVVRGVSDYGDHRKDDDFQRLAALAACNVLRGILERSINFDALPTTTPERFRGGALSHGTESEIEEAHRLKRWEFVVTAGRFLSRPLWLAGLYDERLRIGRLVEEAAATLGNRAARGGALIDDIGWTLFALGEPDRARVAIEDGLRHSVDAEDYFFAAKGARHLASIARRLGDHGKAENWLASALEHASSIKDATSRLEMENSLHLSRAKLSLAQGALDNAMTALDAIEPKIGNLDAARAVKAFSVRGRVLLARGDAGGARRTFEEGYSLAVSIRRRDEAYENALALCDLSLSLQDAVEARRWATAALQDAPPSYEAAQVKRLRALVQDDEG